MTNYDTRSKKIKTTQLKTKITKNWEKTKKINKN